MMTTTIDSSQSCRTETSCKEAITTTTDCPSWKLYENPFYYSQPHHQQKQQQCQSNSKNHLHRLQLPLSARKIAASFWDLTFFRPVMESELDLARAQIVELKAQLEHERKARKKVENMNKKLAKEVAEERKRREAMERVCEELAREITTGKAEIDRRRREMEEERKMMRVAEVLREERVQMKLTEAKILLEEKISELEVSKRTKTESSSTSSPSKTEQTEQSNQEYDPPLAAAPPLKVSSSRLVFGDKSSCNDNISTVSSAVIQRRATQEAENPHIKRGIKGFVEFPKVVRAIGSKSRHWGSKLECQKAQLRILLKQKSTFGSSNNLIIS